MIFHGSEMPRVVPCPGSKLIQLSYPSPPSTEADPGKVAHAVTKAVLKGGVPLQGYLGQSINNVYVDQEMLYHIEVYLGECREPGAIESPCNMAYMGHELRNTPDYWTYIGTTLKIKELKYGHGVVEVFENWQELSYAMAIFDQFSDIRTSCKSVEFTVVQPRANHPEGPIRSWLFDAGLMGGYRNRITAAMEKAASAVPPVQSGPHCRYCPGLLRCHGAAIAAGYALDYAGLMSHGETTPERMALELEFVGRAVSMLSQRKTALEEEAFSMTKAGKVIPGWEVSQTLSALAWDVDALAVGDAMQVDLRNPIKPITPTQAISRKLLTKETVEAIASRSAGGLKLQRVDPNKAKRILTQGDK